MEPTPIPKPRSWTPLIVFAALVGIFIGVPYLVVRPAMPRVLLHRLKMGMTKDEVRAVMGEPPTTYEGGTWEYARFGNAGYVHLHFDDSGRLCDVNDESVFPE